MPRKRETEWFLLRTKTDETTDDPNWAGLNDNPTEPVGDADITTWAPSVDQNGNPVTAIEVVVLGVTSARVPVDRASGTIDVQLVEVIPRDDTNLGGTVGDAVLVVDSAAVTGVPLNRPVLFEINGARQWTVRLTNDASLDAAVDRLQVWARYASL